MKKNLFPVIYAVLTSVLTFLAIYTVLRTTFKLNAYLAPVISIIFAIFFFILSYFRAHASAEIKRIAAKYRLSDQDLADITGLKASDFPIYHDRLSLILPKRYWPKVLQALQAYEEEHQ